MPPYTDIDGLLTYDYTKGLTIPAEKVTISIDEPARSMTFLDLYNQFKKEEEEENFKMEIGVCDNGAKVIFNNDCCIIILSSGYKKVYRRKDMKPEEDKFGTFCLAMCELYLSNRRKYKKRNEYWPLPVNTEHINGETRVMFDDGTTVTAKAKNDDICNDEVGFAVCVCKKVHGSTTKVEEAMNQMIRNAEAKKRKREEHNLKLKQVAIGKRLREEAAKKAHFKMLVENEMELILARREAERRIAAMDAAAKRKEAEG